MSKHDEEMDDNNVICPYCNHQYQPEAEDFDEDERIQECEECTKKFYHHDQISYSHHTRPDCELNGEEHVWEMGTHCNHEFCEVCGIIKPFSDEQKANIRKDYENSKL